MQYAADSGLRQLPMQHDGIGAARDVTPEREHRKVAAVRDGTGVGHAIAEPFHQPHETAPKCITALAVRLEGAFSGAHDGHRRRAAMYARETRSRESGHARCG